VVKVCDLVTDDSTSESNVEWASYTRELLEGDMPDCVFSSEDYAVGWANQMNASHFMVDHERSFHGISGTKIRNDPYLYFHLIHPVARPFYVKKVLIIGGESTGKTTLCGNLALKYQTVFVPEYGRIYVEKHGITDQVKKEIFPAIVNKQPVMEDDLIKQANRVLFCDTDLWTTAVWYEAWQPACVGDVLHQTIMQEADKRHYDLVLLSTHEDTEWVQDGLRDQGDKRRWFTNRLYSTHVEDNIRFLTGSWQRREDTAIYFINQLFRNTKAVLPTQSEHTYVH
jgi:NadR type nicotinamide-nucleotide adenylyltransferase